MLNFKVEWERSPRVRDRLFRATWARLEIHARDGAREVCLTDCLDVRSGSLRRGVYGSVFPVARWIVENWWSLLHESVPSERYQGGRASATNIPLRPWVRRHSLLAARGGFALPDFSLYRDGDDMALRCVPDSEDWEGTYPVRFVSNRDLRFAPLDVERGLRNFIEMVANRVREYSANRREVREFLEDWEAVQESSRSEAGLCEAAAAMGLDPYDPGDLTEEIVSLLEGPFANLPPHLRTDLADSTAGPKLPLDLSWVLKVAGAEEPNMRPTTPQGNGETAHQFGYDSARELRRRLELPGQVDDLVELVRDRCGWDPEPKPEPERDVASRIGGLIGPTGGGTLHLVTSTGLRHPESTRFLIGRALFFSPTLDGMGPARLLTQAASWPQRASRAFAAELLAPAEELATRVTTRVTYDQVAALASDFQVSPMVIQHQLINHHIASVVDF